MNVIMTNTETWGGNLQNTANIFQNLINRLLVVKGTCPECGGDLYAWKNKRPDGSDRCAPTCMNCGFYDLKAKADVQTNQLYEDSLKKRAINFFKYHSVVPDESLFKKSFDNFQTNEEETAIALNNSLQFVDDVVSGENIHFVLSGNSGVGKSHLSMAIGQSIMENSDYQKKCLFINYRELLERRRGSFNNPEEAKNQQELLLDIKTTDFVVIDDLGAELGADLGKGSTSYNNDTLYGILEARQNKALLINTNLTSEEIKKAYGDRILSRIMMNARAYSMRLDKTTDKRIRGVS